MKSGNLNFQEPSGPLQACNGIALPFTTTTTTAAAAAAAAATTTTTTTTTNTTTTTKHGFLSKMALHREVPSVQFQQGRAVYLLYLYGLKIEA